MTNRLVKSEFGLPVILAIGVLNLVGGPGSSATTKFSISTAIMGSSLWVAGWQSLEFGGNIHFWWPKIRSIEYSEQGLPKYILKTFVARLYIELELIIDVSPKVNFNPL